MHTITWWLNQVFVLCESLEHAKIICIKILIGFNDLVPKI